MHPTPHDSTNQALFNDQFPVPARAEEGAVKRVGAPLIGVVVGVSLVLALAGWTMLRVQEAKHGQNAVAAKREEDTKRTAALLLQPTEVQVTHAKPETWQPRLEFDGTLAPIQLADMTFKVPGRLVQVYAKLGDTVKAGSILARLEFNEAEAQYRAAEAQYRAAEAQLLLAQDTARRTAKIVASGSAAEVSGVQTVQQEQLAVAQRDAASAQVLIAQTHLRNHTLTAPFAGTVTRAPQGVGGIVSPGAPLFEIADLSQLKLKGTLAEHDASLAQVGAAVEITTERGLVKAKITSILGVVDPVTRRVPIEAQVPNQGEMRAGTLVRASVHGGSAIPVLRLPREALRPGAQDEVMIVEKGKLSARRLVFSIANDGALLVRRGLRAEERVVLSPKPESRDGDSVRVQEPSDSANPSMDRKSP